MIYKWEKKRKQEFAEKTTTLIFISLKFNLDLEKFNLFYH